MNAKDKERRELMRRIWKLNLKSEEGRYRINRYGTEWLVENFREPSLGHLGQDLRIHFDSYREAKDIPNWERVQRFRQSARTLYEGASMARELGMSYRGFKVGSAVLAFRPRHNHTDSWRVFTGMNTKHARNMRPTCSEPIAINAAYAEGYTLIVGMVVVGELREEDRGVIKTLHPCQECRWFMHGHPIVDKNTIVMTAKPNCSHYSGARARKVGVREVTKVSELLRLHRRISGDDFR